MAYLLSGVTDVGSAGTAVQISNTPRRVLSITFIAPSSNSGNVYVGNNGSGDVAVTTGPALAAGKTITVNPGSMAVSIPISDFWVDAASSGDDVSWFAILWD